MYRAQGVELKEQTFRTFYKPTHITYITRVYFVNYMMLQLVKETISFGSHTNIIPCEK